MELSDEVLIQRILIKDKQALHLFYHRYKLKLLHYIQAKVEKEQDAEEILQDTFFAFLEATRDFHGQSSIKTYLFSICNHKIIDFYRRKKIKHVVFSQLPGLEALISPLLEPEAEYDITEIKDRIRQAYTSLNPLYQQLLRYKYIDGYSVEQIAARLTMSFKSVESKLFRARKAFVLAYQADY
jgi:RNA polymerase sigma-70 factor (ECF subfamily)